MTLTTQQLISALKSANPSETITEDRIRHAIRNGKVKKPSIVGRQFLWDDEAIRELADALDLSQPRTEGGHRGPRDLSTVYRPGEPLTDPEANRLGAWIGRQWREDASEAQTDALAEADGSGALTDASARCVARLFIPEDRWNEFEDSCFWDDAGGDYSYLTNREDFIEGFVLGATTQPSPPPQEEPLPSNGRTVSKLDVDTVFLEFTRDLAKAVERGLNLSDLALEVFFGHWLGVRWRTDATEEQLEELRWSPAALRPETLSYGDLAASLPMTRALVGKKGLGDLPAPSDLVAFHRAFVLGALESGDNSEHGV